MSTPTTLDCNNLLSQETKDNISRVARLGSSLKDIGKNIIQDTSLQAAIGIQLGLDVVVKKAMEEIMVKFMDNVAVALTAKAVAAGVEVVNVAGWYGMALDVWDATFGNHFTAFIDQSGIAGTFQEVFQSIKDALPADYQTCVIQTIQQIYTDAGLTPPTDQEVKNKLIGMSAIYRVSDELPEDWDITGSLFSSQDCTNDQECRSDCLPDQMTSTDLVRPGGKCPKAYVDAWNEYANDKCNQPIVYEPYELTTTSTSDDNKKKTWVAIVVIGAALAGILALTKHTKAAVYMLVLVGILSAIFWAIQHSKEGFDGCPVKPKIDMDACKIMSYAQEHPDKCSHIWCQNMAFVLI